ncbi:hypothetical protein [Marinobacter salsuginis]|uniref:Uncharacterized protein n=1 Tax=Marinobacter salsuginis TaxID=418719 RepID=A0A5M3Q1R4_9GAMM|nr:hypothetical protein [Marinobacter salsuginis]GBO89205.1 hypothetical protein MSSD14B_28730 [Marinobacter salsuginis]
MSISPDNIPTQDLEYLRAAAEDLDNGNAIRTDTGILVMISSEPEQNLWLHGSRPLAALAEQAQAGGETSFFVQSSDITHGRPFKVPACAAYTASRGEKPGPEHPQELTITQYPDLERPGAIHAYGVTEATFQRIRTELDVFKRDDVDDEVILDVNGWDDEQLAPLWEILKRELDHLPTHILFYVNQ